jgi:glyoxylase-like metal-dependent hydrolase (beta-lactamase superfamily II)
MSNFIYVVFEPVSKEALIVDSGWEVEPAVKEIQNKGLSVKYVVATHHHFDHTQTLGELVQAVGGKIAAFQGSPLKTDVSLKDGDSLSLGKNELRVIHTPEHTEDSICLFDSKNLLTGDTLFIGSCGRTDLPGGSVEKLYHSLHRIILRLPKQTVLYPGHDYGDVPFRELQEEAGLNPALTAREFSEFAKLFGQSM